MEEENKREIKRGIKYKNIFILLISLSVIFIGALLLSRKEKQEIKESTMYISSNTYNVQLLNGEFNEVKEIVRGTKVRVLGTVKNNDNEYKKIKIDKDEFYLSLEYLEKNKEDVVKELKMFVRTYATTYKDLESGKITGVLEKGEELDIIGYDRLLEDGSVNAYKVKLEDKEAYVYSKYLVDNKEESILQYEPEKYYDVHNKRKDSHSGVGGEGGNLDYYPVEKPKFQNNVMPEHVYSLYLNSGSGVMNNIDAYIEFAKTTKINSFVVDIKDNESPGYKSNVFNELSPTNYKYANNSFEKYKEAIKKIKDAGFYVIGRITVFKDSYYVADNSDIGIIDTRTNKPFYNGQYWPSPYQRDVWEFNVSLAKEAVVEMGFNEIQFDYVRFPDLIVSLEKKGYLDFKNTYDEDKVEAIQKFLMYACDEIHKLDAYVSADVFGESVNTYITAYGQYWPAISNVVDAISGMPYPDHFSVNSYGIAKPWEEPYNLMYNWSTNANLRQKEIPTPAVARTWILAQNTMKGFEYNATHVEAQIKALKDAGLTGGYMTWSSSSSLVGYQNRKEAYQYEY